MELQFMEAGKTNEARIYTMVVGALMVVLIGYGVLALAGVIK
jgi:hypothetical protein